MSTQNDDEEFEFLLNLLASDGVDPSPPGAGGSRKGHEDDRGFGIKRGADGKLDLGQVKAFYEKKNLGVGKGMGKGPGVGTATDDPGSTDHFRNHSGKTGDNVGQVLETEISVSRSVSEHEDQSVSPLSLTPAPPDAARLSSVRSAAPSFGKPSQDLVDDFQQDSRTEASSSSPPTEESERWVDLLSEQGAKQLLSEISDGLRLKLPPPNKESRSATDRPRTLKNEIKNVVGFLVRMDELVWRRSEYGANREVFDPENISAVEERVRLWERVARDYCSE